MRVIVDSGVWIDLLADRDTFQTRSLRNLLREEHRLLVGDLVLAEVLEGTRGPAHLEHTLARLSEFDPLVIGGEHVAAEAARHHQHLRDLGITIRRTIDTLTATRCIVDGLPLLYADRDFHPFVEHRGLLTADGLVPGVH